MKSLEEILQKYPSSDKGANYHNYLPFYEKHISKFRDNLNNFLEIGIYKGDSLRMWREYFNVGNLAAIDVEDLTYINLPNTYIKICDQSNRNDLKQLINDTFNNFDIIIDDGGHWMHQQQISLGYLFPYLNSNGIYVIEDLHTSGLPSYTRGPSDGDTLQMLYHFCDTGKIISNVMTSKEIYYLENNIAECIIEKGNISPIAFLVKK